MANTKTKIEKYGLADQVQGLLSRGITVANRIAEILREDGHDVSGSAVRRYIEKIKPTIRETSTRIIENHLQEELPKDLDQLEQWQGSLHRWATEEPKDAVDRIAEAALSLDHEVDAWMELVSGCNEADPQERKKFIKAVIAKAIALVLKDARLQDQRIKAMLAAVKIIELKLSKGGLLDGETHGKVVIINRQGDYSPYDPNAPDEDKGRKKMTFPTSIKGGANG